MPSEPGQTPLSTEDNIQLRLSDFPEPTAPRIVAVSLVFKGPQGVRDDKFEEKLMEILHRRTSAPYVLRLRRTLEPDEEPWARVTVTVRKRLDRYGKRGKQPRRGKLRFSIDIATSLPRDHASNWDNYRYDVVFERQYEQLVGLDNDLWASFERGFPSLAVSSLETRLELPRRLELREDLAERVLHKAIDRRVLATFRDGCVAAEYGEGPALFRLRDPSKPMMPLPPVDRIAVRCTEQGVYLAEARTDRMVSLAYQPWSGDGAWTNHATFARKIDVSALRFIAAGDTLCLVGERKLSGERHAKVECFDAATGTSRWEWLEAGTDLEAVAIRNGAVVLAAGRHLRVLELASGTELWSRDVAGASGLSGRAESCLLGDTFVFPYALGRYMAFEVETRTPRWSLNTFGGDFFYCDEAGRIYFDEAGGELLAIDQASTQPLWRFRVAEQVVDALFHGGVLFVLMPGALYALEATTGETLWQVGLPVMAQKLYRYNRRLYLFADETLYELTRRAL